jgi:hypothetical protein
MLLYHGSNSQIEKPLLLKASHPTDFAKRVVNLRNGLAIVNMNKLIFISAFCHNEKFG